MHIDTEFNEAFADQIAILETYNKHLYRPNTYLHKWWARRCGSTFRLILKQLVADQARQDYYTPGGLEGKIILDPMMGGGTTLHEAIRLGANVIGGDIDPIPVIQARATLTNIPLPELQAAFAAFIRQIETALAPYYQTTCPHCATAVPFQYLLYAQHKSCACGPALFLDSLTLRQNNDGSTIHIHPQTHDIYRDDQRTAVSPTTTPKPPLLPRTTHSCATCQQPYQEERQRPYYQRYEPLVVVGECPAHGLFFTTPGPQEQAAIAQANTARATLPFAPADFAIAPGPKSQNLLDRQVHSYLDLFTSRQLLFLQQAIAALRPFAPPIQLNLALLVSTALEFNALLCGYKGKTQIRGGAVRHTFAYHTYSFPYTALENNPIYPLRASGNLRNLFHGRIERGRTWALNPVERRIANGQTRKVIIRGEQDLGTEVADFAALQSGSRRFLLHRGSAVALPIPDASVDFIVTDPPYFDSVQYSDLAAFFRVWLRQLLPEALDWTVPLAETAVEPTINGSGVDYTAILSGIFQECKRVLRPDGRFIFTFHHRNPKGWAALTRALQQAGFVLINRYVVHAENPTSVHIANQTALLHDVILVLAPTPAAPPVWTPPDTVHLSDSKQFCQDCGTIVGWLLSQNLPADQMEREWQRRLDGIGLPLNGGNYDAGI
jgi:SAM-dependent methyltransferase